MNKKTTIREWKQRLQSIGVSEEKMCLWHRLFEQEDPTGHQSFLEWLEIPAETIQKIRQEATHRA